MPWTVFSEALKTRPSAKADMMCSYCDVR